MLFVTDGSGVFFSPGNGFCATAWIFSPQSVQNSSSLAAFSQNKADLIVVSWFAANCLI